MLTHQDIQELIRLPKVIVDRTPSRDYREEDGNRRCDLDLRSADDDGRVYPVFIRQNLRFSGNFSIGLRYALNEGNLATITLVRYNGPHGENSRTSYGHYAKPHIHYLTEDELKAGHTQPQESSRELTDQYTTFEEALRAFFSATSTLNYGEYFPDSLQGRFSIAD